MREWGFGFAILVVSALAVALAAPIFIALFLSASYAPATVYVPWMVLIVFINELNTLSSAGYYARSTGLGVMAVNTCGALVAVAGMLALIGKWGVAGAIAAMIAGQLTRLALFVGETLRSGTMRFPAMRMAIVLALASGAVAVSAASMPIAARVALCAAMLAGVATTLTILGFVQLPRPGQGRH